MAESYADVEELISNGLDHYLHGRLREAAAAFHEALWLDPSNEQAQQYLKSTLGSTGVPTSPSETAPEEVRSAWEEGVSLQEDFVVPDDPKLPAPLLDQVKRPSIAPAKPVPDAHARAEALLTEARSFEARGDFTNALDRCEKVLAIDPAHADALALQQTCTRTLLQMYTSRIGQGDGIPEMVARPDEVIWLNLDHRAGFVLAQIDGQLTYDDLYAVCGMSQLDTAKLLSELLVQNVIRTKSHIGARKSGR